MSRRFFHCWIYIRNILSLSKLVRTMELDFRKLNVSKLFDYFQERRKINC